MTDQTGGNATPHRDSFKRTLGLASLVAVAIGIVVGQGPIVSAMQGFALGGSDFLIAMAIAFFIALFSIFSFAELSLMFPRAGTLGSYTEVAMGHFPAMASVLGGYVAVAFFGLTAELLLIGFVTNSVFPWANPTVVAVVMLAAVTLVNIMGTDIFAKLQNVLAFSMAAVMTIVGLGALLGLGNDVPEGVQSFANFTSLTANGWVGLIGLAIWMLIAQEFVCPLIEESKDPERNVPKAMIIGLVSVAVVYLFFCLGAMKFMTPDMILGSTTPHIDYVTSVFGQGAMWVAVVIALTAGLSTINSVIAAIPRMVYGLAHNGQAPKVFMSLHPTARTPRVAIVAFSICVLITLLTAGTNFDTVIVLLIAAGALWLMAYIIAHLDVIILRRRYPDMARPFRTPFYPVPQIVGIVAMIYVIWNNSPAPELTAQIWTYTGTTLAIVLVVSALWVTLVMKKGLFTPETPKHALED